jgi:hypothetical protein
MTAHVRRAAYALAVALTVAWGSGDAARAQTPFLRGQNIQPVYEGFEKNRDGSISMVFGYMNRNFEEEPYIPVGPDNSFEPGPQDRGQPTHFDTRRQSFVFRVNLPLDWGTKDLVWTVNHNGRANTAIGSLMPHWVIDEGVWKANRGAGISGRTAEDYLGNEPPVIAIVGQTNIKARVGESVTLTASATDDGRPGPKPKPKSRAGADGEGGPAKKVVLSNPDLPTVGGDHSGAASGTGGPTDQNVVRVSTAYETGLAITWRQYRGPGKVSFAPRATPIKSGGKATTTVQFTEPGTYVIRAVADDSTYTSGADVTVVVDSASPSR